MFEGILSPSHLLLVLVIMMLFLGPKKLPELGKSLGEAIRGFRDSVKAPPPPEPPKPELTDATKQPSKT